MTPTPDPGSFPAVSRPPTGGWSGAIYLLTVGVVLGILLGPAVLGRLWPRGYDRVFTGVWEQRLALQEFEKREADTLLRMEETGVSPAAVQERKREIQQQRLVLTARMEQARVKQERTVLWCVHTGMMLLTLLMLGEATLAEGSRWHLRLKLLRYALAAGWVALVLARPGVVFP